MTEIKENLNKANLIKENQQNFNNELREFEEELKKCDLVKLRYTKTQEGLWLPEDIEKALAQCKEEAQASITEKDSIIENLHSDIRTEQDAQEELNETNKQMYDHIVELKAELEQACMLLALTLGNTDDVDSDSITHLNTKKNNKDANSWLEFIRSEE